MAAAGQTAAGAVTARETATQPCNTLARATGSQQTMSLPSSSAGLPRYIPSTLPYHLHPVFTGPKRVQRAPQDVASQTDKSLLDLPPRPNKKIHLYHAYGAEELQKCASALGMSVITPAAAQAEVHDSI
eukprot:1874627-Pleurochrysis_carterae.AAC.2